MRNMERALIFSVALFSISAIALAGDIEYVLISPTGPYTNWSRTETQPLKGASYTDNNAHTSITRITNGQADGVDAAGVHPEYSWNCVSSDKHYAIFEDASGGGFFLYDLTTTTPTYIQNIGAIIGYPNGLSPEPRWDHSGSSPTILYYRTGSQFRYLDVSDYSTHLIRDFASIIGSGNTIWMGDEGQPSSDSSKWAWMISPQISESPNWQYPIGMISYDKTTDTFISSRTCAADANFNNIYVSPSGAYFITSNETQGSANWQQGTWAWSFDTGQPLHYLFPHSEHQCVAYDMQGNEVIVYNNRDTDFWCFSRLDNGTAYRVVDRGAWEVPAAAWSAGWQLHAPGPSKKGWAFMSIYNSDFPDWFSSQIFGINLDETRHYDTTPQTIVWRVCATQNDYETYFQQENMNVSDDGSQIYFGSNWRSHTNDSEVYRVNMPAHWYTDLGGEEAPQDNPPTQSVGSLSILNMHIDTLR